MDDSNIDEKEKKNNLNNLEQLIIFPYQKIKL